MIHLRRFFQLFLMVFSVLVLCVVSAQAGPCEIPEFDPGNFSSPIDNPYFPMPARNGTAYVYEAETDDEFVLNIIFISNKTREIMGVDCTIVYDTEWVYVEDEDEWFVTETTEDWHAWDNEGNFWYFGEWTTEFEFDEDWGYEDCNHEGSWEAGEDVAGVGSVAEPGIIIPADPVPGDCYLQEYYEDEAEDMCRILSLNGDVSTEFDVFDHCLVTKEWTPLELGHVEHKYYKEGVGLVFIEELKEKTVFVELVDKYDGKPDYSDYPGLPKPSSCH